MGMITYSTITFGHLKSEILGLKVELTTNCNGGTGRNFETVMLSIKISYY